jgi:hypothetical protein
MSRSLGLGVASLQRLGIGHCGWAWTFPMFDARGVVCGIRIRRGDGKKLSVSGSRSGVFVPRDLVIAGRLLICEGPTDTAAMLDVGFAAIGRPSCSTGTDLTCRIALSLAPLEVVIIADRDAYGHAGALRLATSLRPRVRALRIVTPPSCAHDARAWVVAGARHEDISAAIDTAEPVRLRVRGALS